MRLRRGRIYPRHFSTPITKTTHSFSQTVDASAKGSLDIRVKLAVTVAASEDLSVLVRVGGWAPDAIARAAGNSDTHPGYVKGYTELHDVKRSPPTGSADISRNGCRRANVSSGSRSSHLRSPHSTRQSPDRQAIRQREHARILEQTEISASRPGLLLRGSACRPTKRAPPLNMRSR